MAIFPWSLQGMNNKAIFKAPTQRQWRKMMKANASRRRGRKWGLRLRLAALGIIGVVLIAALAVDQGSVGGWSDGDGHSEKQLPKSIHGGNAWNGGKPKLTNADLTGRVTHVRDGDTIEVSGRPIRFAKLDCAELGTPSGNRAKQRMSSLVRGQTVSCRLTGRKSYDRWIGSCSLSDGRDIASSMVQGGVCSWWRG